MINLKLKLKGEELKKKLNIKDGEPGSPDTPAKIVDKLESLKGEKRLDASAIKNLEKDTKLSDAIVNRALGIVDQRTSFLINKVSNLSDKVNNLPTGGGDTVWQQDGGTGVITPITTGDVDLGTSSLTAGNIRASEFDVLNGSPIIFYSDSGATELGEMDIVSSDQYRFLQVSQSVYGILDFSQLTADQTYTFPDKSGTVALAEDVVPYTGATQDVDIGANKYYQNDPNGDSSELQLKIGIGDTLPATPYHHQLFILTS